MGAGELALWEQIALGAIIVALMFYLFPRIKGAKQRSDASDQPQDWMSVLIPIGLVVLFVIVLIQLA